MCAITGIWRVPMAATVNCLSLHAQQHRAQDFAGMTVSQNEQVKTKHGKGTVWEVFDDDLSDLPGENAVGQLRYPTANDNTHAQPIFMGWGESWIALAHNGNLTNTATIMVDELPEQKCDTGMDSEVLLRLIIASRPTIPTTVDELCEIIDQALAKTRGSASLTILTPFCLLAVRDPSGNRPLVYGWHKSGGVIVASEESALFVQGIYEATIVKPGTIVAFTSEAYEYQLRHATAPLQYCPFEHAYYSMFTGAVNGIEGDDFRIEIGKQLAREYPVHEADIIMPAPDSSIPAAIGFALANGSGMYNASVNGMYNDLYLRRSHYVTRTFIDETQQSRDAGVKLKFHFNPRKIKNKIIVLVDDSLIRGTTTKELARVLYAMGAKEVHVRIAWPIWQYICTYGIATKKESELAVHKHRGVGGIRQFIEAASLEFLSSEGLRQVLSQFEDPNHFCLACITGDYRL